MATIIKHLNDEIIVVEGTKEQAINKLMEVYGFEIGEVAEVQAYNGELHSKDYVNEQEAIKQEQARLNKIAELKKELERIDLATIRPLRANEQERLAELEAQAIELRNELKNLQGA